MATIANPEFQALGGSRAAAESAALDGAGESASARAVARLWLLWGERRFLFRISAWGCLGCTLLAFLIPQRFQSSAQLMPPDDQSSSGLALAASLASKLNGPLGGLAGGMLGLKNSGDLFVGILGSRTVEDALIARFDLRRVYGVRFEEAARKALAANTTIAEDRKSGIITISVADRDPQRAAALAQEYVAELNAVVSQLTTSSARRERIFLEGRLAQVRQELEEAERDFSQFASRNAAVDIKEQGRAMVGAAASLEGQLIAAQSELQGLKQIYSDHNVRIRSLTARIAELQSRMAQLGGREKEQAGGEKTGEDRKMGEEMMGEATIGEVKTREDKPGGTGQLGAEAAASGNPDLDLYPSLRQLPLLGVPYADLYRRTRVQEAVFETLTQEYEMAKVAEAKEIPSVRLLDAPEVPERRSFPPRAPIIVLGTFFTLVVSALAVLLRARWQGVPAEDPQKLLLEEVVRTLDARMPWAPPNGSRFQALTHRWWLRLERRPPAAPDPDPDSDSDSDSKN